MATKISEDDAQKFFGAIEVLRMLEPFIDMLIPAEKTFIDMNLGILFELVAVLRSTQDEEYQKQHLAEHIRKNWQDAIDAKFRAKREGETGSQPGG